MNVQKWISKLRIYLSEAWMRSEFGYQRLMLVNKGLTVRILLIKIDCWLTINVIKFAAVESHTRKYCIFSFQCWRNTRCPVPYRWTDILKHVWMVSGSLWQNLDQILSLRTDSHDYFEFCRIFPKHPRNRIRNWAKKLHPKGKKQESYDDDYWKASRMNKNFF